MLSQLMVDSHAKRKQPWKFSHVTQHSAVCHKRAVDGPVGLLGAVAPEAVMEANSRGRDKGNGCNHLADG